MSIREILEKIKTYAGNDRIFLPLLIVLVAGASFGIGRLSVSDKVSPSIQKTFVQPSTSLVASSITSTTASSSATTSQGASTAPEEALYVGSKNSDKYHLPWCSGAKRIQDENKVWFKSTEEAEKAGYVPAGNCPGIQE